MPFVNAIPPSTSRTMMSRCVPPKIPHFQNDTRLFQEYAPYVRLEFRNWIPILYSYPKSKTFPYFISLLYF